jgi:phosphoglycolate phosphatase
MISQVPDLVIFDLDGTLADTIEDIAASVNRALSQFKLPPHEVTIYKRMVGDGFRPLIERALPQEKLCDEALLEQVFECAVHEYAEHSLENTRPFPGMIETLETLSRKSVRLAVLSNKPDTMSIAIVKNLFGSIPFVAVWGNNPERPRKPNPSAALEICRIAEAVPAHSLFVGDSGVDMETAKAAGMIAIGALYGYRSRKELEKAGADYCIASPLELLSLIGRT